MKLSIRPVLEMDAHAITLLINPIILQRTLTSMQDVLTIDVQRDFIRSLPRKSTCLVAVDEMTGRIVGIQDVLPVANSDKKSPEVGEISTFVDLAMARNGIGSRLCAETFAVTKLIGFSRLRATIRRDNQPAIEFYQRMGFRIDGHVHDSKMTWNRSVDLIGAEKLL